MAFETNELFGKMLKYFIDNYRVRKKAEIVNVGGTRSGKTYDCAFMLMYLADKYKVENRRNDDGTFDSVLNANGSERLIIDVYRNELKKVRKTFEDFLACISLMGIGKRVVCSSINSDRPTITFPNGNVISFYGLPDDGTMVEASKSHIVYFNEALEIPTRSVISNIVMRCEMMIIYDANPRETTHWLFDLGESGGCLYTHTTYKDNKFLPPSIIQGIESMCPWDLSDYVKDEASGRWYWTKGEDERKPNEVNLSTKSANRRNWLVYGEGLRCAREGSAFEDVIWVADIPDDIEIDSVVWGLDFGYRVHESALSVNILSGGSIYSKCLLYKSFDNPERLFEALEPILSEQEEWYKSLSEFDKEKPPMYIVCESQDNFEGTHFVQMIKQVSMWRGHFNWDFGKVSKRPRFKQDLISNINRFSFHVVRTSVTETELLNYVFEERNGEITSKLHGTRGRNDHDHYIDSVLYACWLMLRYVSRNTLIDE
jgi:PBSX family phage terminase large subunit